MSETYDGAIELQRKQYIDAPDVPPLSALGKILYALVGAILSPPVALAAIALGVEGAAVRRRCFALGATLLRKPTIDNLKLAYGLLFNPMDSTRYFEIAAVLEGAAERSAQRYLDISSPRLAPLFVARAIRPATTTVLNPDTADLEKTQRLYRTFFRLDRIEFRNATLGQFARDGAAFDLVTSVSVFEHVPDDREMIRQAWSLVAPGGTLIVTIPCAKDGWTQYINRYTYGVLDAEADGYTFWQRFYTATEIAEKFDPTCGSPSHTAFYGERRRGAFYLSTCVKRSTNHYAFWMEPWRMLRDYRRYASIDELPGEGVALLVFRK